MRKIIGVIAICITLTGCAVGDFAVREVDNFVTGATEIYGFIQPFSVNMDYLGDINRSTVLTDEAELAAHGDEIWREDFRKYVPKER